MASQQQQIWAPSVYPRSKNTVPGQQKEQPVLVTPMDIDPVDIVLRRCVPPLGSEDFHLDHMACLPTRMAPGGWEDGGGQRKLKGTQQRRHLLRCNAKERCQVP
jgi:hypothetical protein